MKQLDKLMTSLKQGEISRRDFIQRAGALGLASVIPGALLGEAQAPT